MTTVPPHLLQEYQKSIPEKLNNLEKLIEAAKVTQTAQALEELKFAVHKLAGSAGTYGYQNVSKICKETEQKILNHDPKLDLNSLLTTIKKGFYG